MLYNSRSKCKHSSEPTEHNKVEVTISRQFRQTFSGLSKVCYFIDMIIKKMINSRTQLPAVVPKPLLVRR